MCSCFFQLVVELNFLQKLRSILEVMICTQVTPMLPHTLHMTIRSVKYAICVCVHMTIQSVKYAIRVHMTIQIVTYAIHAHMLPTAQS